MAQKKLYRPCAPIKQWIVIVYEQKRRFDDNRCADVIKGLVTEARNMGMSTSHLLQYALTSTSQA